MFNFGKKFAKLLHELKILIRNLEKLLKKELSTNWLITFNKVCLENKSFFNIEKAYNKISHQKSLEKLEYIDIQN